MKKKIKTIIPLLIGVILFPTILTAEDEATPPTLGRWQQFYADRVELFEEENAKLDPAVRPIVFAGDSLTQGMPIERLYPGHVVLNRGIVSDGIANFPGKEGPHYRGLINRLDSSIFIPNPQLLFILMGSNDVGQNIPFDYWESQLVAILDQVAGKIPDCQVVLQTMPPTGEKYKRMEYLNPRIKEYNERIKALAKKRGLPLVDVWSLYANEVGILPAELTRDGLHLKKSAYDRWATEARKYFPQRDDKEARRDLILELERLAEAGATRLPPEYIWTTLTNDEKTTKTGKAFEKALNVGGKRAKLALIRALELEFIHDSEMSVLDCLGPELSDHFRKFDWQFGDYPGGPRGENEAFADVMVDALDLIFPERRANRTRRAVVLRGEATEEVWEYMTNQWVPVPEQEDYMLNRHARDAFVKMREQARKEGVELIIRSAHRTRKRAEANAARAKNSNAVASFSAHSLGLAIDFQMSHGDLKFAEITTRPMSEVVRMRESPVHKWLFLRGAEFGWGPYQNEPWHWEYNPQGFRDIFWADFPGGAPERPLE